MLHPQISPKIFSGQPKQNPKGHVNVVTLRNGKQLYDKKVKYGYEEMKKFQPTNLVEEEEKEKTYFPPPP